MLFCKSLSRFSYLKRNPFLKRNPAFRFLTDTTNNITPLLAIMETPQSTMLTPKPLDTSKILDPEKLVPSNSYNETTCRREILEQTMAKLDAGNIAVGFSSSMHSIMAILGSLPFTFAFLPDDLSFKMSSELLRTLQAKGINFERLDMSDHKKVSERFHVIQNQSIRHESGKKPRYIVWIESPSFPMCKITDIGKIVALSHQYFSSENCIIVVDSTLSTPALSKPLTFGANISFYSDMKFISGRDDCGGSVVVMASGTFPLIAEASKNILEYCHDQTNVMTSRDADLAITGILSMQERMERRCSSAMILAEYLSGHKHVKRVHYPGLISNSGNLVATRQMDGMYGTIVTFSVKDVYAAQIEKVVQYSKLFKLGSSSPGNSEAFIDIGATENQSRIMPHNVLAISVGDHEVDELLTELETALSLLER